MPDRITPARWRSLCEHFVAIKLGAYRHDLAADLRALTSADPALTPDLLDDWEQLEERIAELDDLEDDKVTRHGDATLKEAPHWLDEEREYICPMGCCDRRVSAAPGTVPRCDLFDRAMNPESAG